MLLVAHHHSIGVVLLLAAFAVVYGIGLVGALLRDRRDRS